MALRQKIGLVVSDKCDKTAVVAIFQRDRKNFYGKTMVKTVRYLVHDPENKGKLGSKVQIVECAPKSAKKRWELESII
jgi:small subunit ribosomal protein S17